MASHSSDLHGRYVLTAFVVSAFSLDGFYDPELNAVFIHSAGDSEDDGTIWVYRYRRVR